MSEERATGTFNVTYNFVSLAYHAFHGEETYEVYIEDAEKNDDSAAADRFREAQQQNRRLADQAEKLMDERLSNR